MEYLVVFKDKSCKLFSTEKIVYQLTLPSKSQRDSIYFGVYPQYCFTQMQLRATSTHFLVITKKFSIDVNNVEIFKMKS